MQKIRYFDIAWLSSKDGPGMRLVVFFQGCHLRCKWCHSPHSWNKYSPILLNRNLCKLCRKCEEVCKNGVHEFRNNEHLLNSGRCKSCGECIKACSESSLEARKGALILPTREADAEELFNNIYPQLKILKNIGGITLSGGEALLQYEGARELLKLCKDKGIDTAVESSGLLPLDNYKHVYDLVDCWLISLKGLDESSRDFSRLHVNLSFLTGLQKEILLRMPLVSGYTDAEEQLILAKNIMKVFSLKTIQLLPYNTNASHYYEAMNIPYELKKNPGLGREDIEGAKRFFQRFSIQTI